MSYRSHLGVRVGGLQGFSWCFVFSSLIILIHHSHLFLEEHQGSLFRTCQALLSDSYIPQRKQLFLKNRRKSGTNQILRKYFHTVLLKSKIFLFHICNFSFSALLGFYHFHVGLLPKLLISLLFCHTPSFMEMITGSLSQM